MTNSPDALKRRALYQRHCQGSTHRSDGRRDNAAERMRASRRTATIFPTGGVISVPRGPGRQGVRGVWCGLRYGGKREQESCWKSGGGRARLYTWRRAGLADEVGRGGR
jgi:hypothetical protein